MPDALGKFTLLFYAAGNTGTGNKVLGSPPVGWTETFYTPFGVSDPNLSSIVTKYVKARVALLGIGATVQAARLSNIPANRATTIDFLGGIAKVGAIFTRSPEDDYDPCQVDLLVRMETASNKRRQMWLSGLPDSQTDTLLQQGINGNFINSPAFKQWKDAIFNAELSIRYISVKHAPPTPNEFLAEPISKITPIMVRKRNRGRPFFLFRGRRIA